MITDANRSTKGSSKTGIGYCGWTSIRPTVVITRPNYILTFGGEGETSLVFAPASLMETGSLMGMVYQFALAWANRKLTPAADLCVYFRLPLHPSF